MSTADTSSNTVADDLGLPAKPIALSYLAVAVAVPLVATAPAGDTAKPAATKTTTTVASTTATKKATTTKTTAKTTAKATAAAVEPAATTSTVTARQDLAASVAAATNAERVAAGLKALTYKSCSVPTAWAVHLASTGSLTHNSMTTVLSSCGGKTTAGENIASGFATAAGVTSGWMNSAGHKANILNPNYTTISVGVAQAADGTYYWVENFTG